MTCILLTGSSRGIGAAAKAALLHPPVAERRVTVMGADGDALHGVVAGTQAVAEEAVVEEEPEAVAPVEEPKEETTAVPAPTPLAVDDESA